MLGDGEAGMVVTGGTVGIGVKGGVGDGDCVTTGFGFAGSTPMYVVAVDPP